MPKYDAFGREIGEDTFSGLGSGASDNAEPQAEAVTAAGAEGVLGIGLPDGRGAALKVLDGATRALDVVAPLLLEQHWDIAVGGAALDNLREGPVHNSRGERVGGAEATLGA